MRELAILTFVSADRVMQAPKMQEEDTSGGFTQGGWANPCWDDVMQSVGEVAMSKPYDVLLGRNTYDAFAPHHSASDSPLNKLTKYVVTSHPISKPWQPTIEIRQDVAGTIANLTLAILGGEYAEVMTSDDVIAQFTGSKALDG